MRRRLDRLGETHAGVAYDPAPGLRAANVTRGEALAALRRHNFVIDREFRKASGDEEELQIRRRTISRGRASGCSNRLT